MKCDSCGRILIVGDWPFCKGRQDDHTPTKRFNMDPISPYWDDDITEDGAWITTRQQRRQIMNERNLDYKKPKGYAGKVKYLDMGGR